MLDARRRRTPGRETEKAAPGVNSRKGDRSQKSEDGGLKTQDSRHKTKELITSCFFLENSASIV